jgi:hypothetical protein
MPTTCAFLTDLRSIALSTEALRGALLDGSRLERITRPWQSEKHSKRRQNADAIRGCGVRGSMKRSSMTVIDQPADRIDLAQWLSTMSDRDYHACSQGHRAAGTFREGGTFGMVNVESVGGHLLVQHYLAKEATANHVLMHSTNTRVYVLHIFPFTIEVIWTLGVERRDSQTAEFTCTVEARMPAPLRFVASLGLLPLARARGNAPFRLRHRP